MDTTESNSSDNSTVSNSPSLRHPKSLSCSPSSDIANITNTYRKFSISSPDLSREYTNIEEITEIRSDNIITNNIVSRNITTPPVKSHHNNLEGTLFKFGGVFGVRKERYYILRGEEMKIVYYKNKSACLNNKKPRGEIYLEGASAKKNIKDNGKDFVVFYPYEIDRGLFFFRSTCETQTSTWVNAINSLNKHNEKVHTIHVYASN